LEAMEAIQSQRNQVWMSGVHGLEDFAGANFYFSVSTGTGLRPVLHRLKPVPPSDFFG
jgi:hypothetical protein